MTIEEIRRKIIPILQANGVEYAAIFGSAARGETRSGSDIDLLVRYTITPGLFDHIGLSQDLEDILKTRVDLVTERSLNKSLVPFIKKDLQILYGETQRSDLH